MILIFSNSSDKSTHQVIEWLVAKKKEYLFINEASPITDIAVEVNNFCTELFLTIDNRRININKIQSVWFRSGSFFSKSNFNTRALPDIFTTHFNFFIKNENAILEEFLFRELSKKCLINNKSDDHINKLTILTIAASIGLTIPVTNVFIKNNELDKEKEYIIKPLSNSISFYFEDYMCRLLTQQYIRQESNNFPTLIQEEIKKQFEIRVFYLRSRCYSIAMFTQTNETTKTDYRNYNFTAPVRSVPFNLPRSLDIKVKQLMKEINLNSGSIDFIYSSNNEFIFLEVNPLGQFGNVSAAGNYFIEKKIANLLYDKQNSNRKKH